jgi:hypothetical protein
MSKPQGTAEAVPDALIYDVRAINFCPMSLGGSPSQIQSVNDQIMLTFHNEKIYYLCINRARFWGPNQQQGPEA